MNLLKFCESNEKLVSSGDSDISDHDCSGLLDVSDDSDVVVDKNSDPENGQSSCVGEQQATSLCSTMGNAQDLINREILQQLQTIGQRLDHLETNKCKN